MSKIEQLQVGLALEELRMGLEGWAHHGHHPKAHDALLVHINRAYEALLLAVPPKRVPK